MPDLTFDSPSDDMQSLAQITIGKSVGLIEPPDFFREQWSGPALLEYYIASGLPTSSLVTPGDGYHYCDTGPVISALIIERITGQSLADAYRERIFDPLGMDDTYLHHYERARQTVECGRITSLF